jgi:hypothetical protein
MAAFTASSSTLTTSQNWRVVAAPYGVKYKVVSLVLSSQGGATNTIGATALGFTKILGSSAAIKSDDSAVYPTSPSTDGSKLFFINLAQATDASRPAPADVTGTFKLTIWGC